MRTTRLIWEGGMSMPSAFRKRPETAWRTSLADRMVALLPLVFLLASCANNQNDSCADRTYFALPPKLTLGECVPFSNEIDTTFCRNILAEGQSIGWFDYLIKVHDHRIGLQCRTENTGSTYEFGYVDEAFTELIPPADAGSDWTVSEFPIPGLGYFSNPSICGAAIAYWQLADDGLSTIVFDVARQSVVDRQAAGPILLETDYRYVLPAPEWDRRCRSVRFHVDYGLDQPFERRVLASGE